MKLYLITGFLGAGKTTFLKNFLQLFETQKVYVIINEFGREGVDGTLISEMSAHIAEINNGSIFCACRLDKFEEELNHIIKHHGDTDVIIVEASGLSEPGNIHKLMQTNGFESISYCGSICLIDAVRFEKVKTTARMVPKQIKVSSLGLINKSDLVSEEKTQIIKQDVLSLNPAINLECTSFGAIDPKWLDFVSPSLDIESALNTKDITLQKATITIPHTMSYTALMSLLQMISEDTYRIKGFVYLDNRAYLVDCVSSMVNCSPYKEKTVNENKLTVLAGSGMSLRNILKEAHGWYPDIDISF